MSGVTPWQRRHRKVNGSSKFKGQLVAFGSKVHYLQTAAREVEERQKAGPRMVEGLFAGYKLLHDARWSGEYLVHDRLGWRTRPAHPHDQGGVPPWLHPRLTR